MSLYCETRFDGKDRDGAYYSVQLLEKARADADTVLKELGSQLDGLSEAEADSRLKQLGKNEIAREKHKSVLMRLLRIIMNPLVLLLLALGVLSYLTGDLRALKELKNSKEANNEHDYDKRWYSYLLQGLGHGKACGVQPRLAAECG